MTQAIQLIVGLGNPGKEYEATRHNAGAWFIETLSQEKSIHFKQNAKFQGAHAVHTLHGAPCHLFVPNTFMNHSGQAVSAIMNYYHIPTDALLIAHDEIDMPAGIIKLKFDGGDGGHNGLKDVIRHLHTKKFYRLRIGVGRPNHQDVSDYVLTAPSRSDQKKINEALLEVNVALPFIMSGEMQKAMQLIHTRSLTGDN